MGTDIPGTQLILEPACYVHGPTSQRNGMHMHVQCAFSKDQNSGDMLLGQIWLRRASLALPLPCYVLMPTYAISIAFKTRSM